MKEFFVKNKRNWIDLLVLFCSLVFISICYLIFKPIYRIEGVADGFASRIFIYTAIFGWIIALIVLFSRKKLTLNRFLFLLFILAILLRVAYMLITPFDYRQHDTTGPVGHEAYAGTIYYTGGLPVTNEYQFYHPPFNAFMQSTWMHIFKPFLMFANFFIVDPYKFDVNNLDVLYESTQILSCFYMVIVVYLVIRIFKSINLSKPAKLFGICFIIFFPRLIQFAAQENNDPLCVLFCFFTIFFTFRYAKNKSWFNTLAIGVSVGLAMMAKLSGAVIALVPGAYFIYDFVKAIKSRKDESTKVNGKPLWCDLLLKYVSLVVVAFALGLWFSIYAKVRFDQPFGYVYPLSEDSDLYHGDVNFFARLINIFDFVDFYKVIYGNTFVNYNLFNFTVRSALFGEFGFLNADYLAVFAQTINYLFVILSIVNFIILLCSKGKKQSFLISFAIILIATQYLAQIYFNATYPFGCTMDFRYIVPIVFGFGLMQALSLDAFYGKKNWKSSFTLVTTILGSTVIASTVIFYLIVI